MQKNSLESLNEIIDESTLIRHGLHQFKEYIDLKADINVWKKLTRIEKTWKKFKSLFTKAINGNKNDAGTLKAIGIANAVKEKVNQNKEKQRVLAQATVEANNKIEQQLEKQQAQLCGLNGKTTNNDASTGHHCSHNQSINRQNQST
jgi:hypothetical protein